MGIRLFLLLLVLSAFAWSRPAMAGALQLDDETQRWLAVHRTIYYAPESDYGPFVFTDAQGVPQGLSVDFLQLIGEQAGIRFAALPAAPLSQNLEGVKLGKVDVLTSLRPTPERAQWLDFSKPYVLVPAALAVRSGAGQPDLAALAGKRVAVGKGYAVEGFVREHYPSLRWEAVPDDASGLRLLRGGQVEAMVLDEASFAFIVKREGWKDLTLGDRVGYDYPLSMAYRKDWPELGRIFDAALLALPPDQKTVVLTRWLPERQHGTRRGDNAIAAGGIAIVAAGIAVLLYSRLRKQRAA
ncbi:ABC-type amino acid transport substrate-binding protein [Andreprevotia lacus DSM 23236]|jgi:ABC-type amino acid transport substrate-binding protein|uniref:ABC-type amino acid transport substrate-binding protein n=1 Tax=Andreprevotia lacus DSM 23236 TaxID=1121001 RepID=A0A1W1XNM4_9NEIS|nr:transporter substrate-binding domain-containing protein [Andreprevotia lacus]SMC25580.1 ABC-type amino acid transport substrate-binding protein [Andreprevotia lacus DSM 23236]